MKVLFHTHSLNYRGTAVAVLDYAKYNQEVLGNESIIIYREGENDTGEKDGGHEQEVIDIAKKSFEVRSYSSLDDLNNKAKDVDTAYFIKYGFKDDPLPDVRSVVHAVFQAKDPHGDRYAYISEWLSQKMGGDIPFVPHIVDLPEPNDNYRKRFNIPDDKIVIGRIGGYYTFDLDFVKNQIKSILDQDDRFVFIFVNTQPFIKHKNVIYVDKVVDKQKKSNFINTCDAMIHARARGESFGLSVCEFLYHNKPVLAWNNGLDQNHIHILKDMGSLYDENTIGGMFNQIPDLKNKDWKSLVTQFNSKNVMQKFDEVFLK